MADVLTGTSLDRAPAQETLPLGLVLQEPNELLNRYWGNAKPPSEVELATLARFGEYADFDVARGRISERVRLEVADLAQATKVIVYHHYLHRGRTMAQLPYWIFVDDVPVGVLLYAYPRLSVPLHGVQPLNLLELARIWIHGSVQGQLIQGSDGRQHAPSILSCAISKSIRRLRQDWFTKYPKLPDVLALVTWADDVHHEGTIYRASNFQEMGKSGGSFHGSRRRNNGGADKRNADYANVKTCFMHRFASPFTDKEKRHVVAHAARLGVQLPLM